mgnify:CR=1 FL=1
MIGNSDYTECECHPASVGLGRQVKYPTQGEHAKYIFCNSAFRRNATCTREKRHANPLYSKTLFFRVATKQLSTLFSAKKLGTQK